jgi:hypothetical protein
MAVRTATKFASARGLLVLAIIGAFENFDRSVAACSGRKGA